MKMLIRYLVAMLLATAASTACALTSQDAHQLELAAGLGHLPARDALKAAARQGDPEGQLAYGIYLLNRHDYAPAAHWIRKSAEQGLPLAQEMLGVMYHVGAGVPKDLALAEQWFE